jgi:hypothetical protein
MQLFGWLDVGIELQLEIVLGIFHANKLELILFVANKKEIITLPT